MKTTYNPLLFRLDGIGAFLSMGCAIHCALFPLLLAALPMTGLQFFDHPLFEKLFVALAIGLAAVTHTWGFHVHGKKDTLFGVGAAVVFIGVGQFLAHGVWEVLFMILGGVILTFSHMANRFFCRTCTQCQDRLHKGHSVV